MMGIKGPGISGKGPRLRGKGTRLGGKGPGTNRKVLGTHGKGPEGQVGPSRFLAPALNVLVTPLAPPIHAKYQCITLK